MAQSEVFAGICGFSAWIDVKQLDNKNVQVLIRSECEQIMAMNSDLTCIQWKGRGHQVFRRMTDSAIYHSSDKHIRHTGCPIPAAILKTIEVEVGIALPEDVTISFVNFDSDALPDSSFKKVGDMVSESSSITENL
ncbi:MAG: hypothetical protein BMS9Abin02_1226 [Anaerolineae bacterium]|nr:MAG: hypothetical protein BMS9Abin02_1226 [Anaerolineae bacterium]